MKLLIAATLGLLTLSVHASESTVSYKDEYCSVQGDIAYDTMRFRQAGGEKTKIQSVVTSEESLTIINMAFERPLTTNKSYAMQSFKEHVLKLCISNIKG